MKYSFFDANDECFPYEIGGSLDIELPFSELEGEGAEEAAWEGDPYTEPLAE